MTMPKRIALMVVWSLLCAVQHPVEPAQDTVLSPAVLKAEILKLRAQEVSEEILVRFVAQHALTQPLTTEDVMDWKLAGIPEKAIEAAMKRVRADPRFSLELALENKDVVIDLTLMPIVFHTARVQVTPRKSDTNVIVSVFVSNVGRRDCLTSMTATLLDREDKAILTAVKRREVERGEKKAIEVKFRLAAAAFSSLARCKLELGIE